MAFKYQSFPGMDDILPGTIEKWQWLEQKARIFFESWGCQEIRTPALEPTELFARSIGETSDIVHKEMYSFLDRGERSMTLRPEMTASVARAVIQNGMLKTARDLALYYLGPMFRAERPQAGRKRQFHQAGVEIVNRAGLETDLAIIRMLCGFLGYVGVKDFELRVNDLGFMNGQQGDKVRGELKKYFEKHKAELDKDSLYRLEKNVLRIFDSKNEAMQKLLEKTPWDEIAPFSAEFSKLVKTLETEKIPCRVSRRLVRGLDYYTGIVFEIAAGGLGAQDAVAGGGRYDHLYEELGAPPTPCTGFSIGLERLLTVLEKQKPSLDERLKQDFLFLVPVCSSETDKACEDVRAMARKLISLGFSIKTAAPSENLNDHFKKANKIGAEVIILRKNGEERWIFRTRQGEKTFTQDELLNHLRSENRKEV